MYYVYILQSKINRQIYIGSTNDLKKRFKEHNNGKSISTKRYMPWILVYYEAYNTEKLARLREKALKYHGNAMKELKKRTGLMDNKVALPSTTFLNKIKSGAGFTLIELIIYSGILIMVLTFTGEYLYSIGQARINNAARVEVAQAAELIINKIKSDVTSSTTINIPITLESNSLDININEDNIVYNLSDTQLLRLFNTETNNLSSNQVKVSDLKFYRIANNSGIVTIQMRFTLTSLAQLSGGRNVQESFQTTFSQRK